MILELLSLSFQSHTGNALKPVLITLLTLLLTASLCHARTDIEGELSGVLGDEDDYYRLVDDGVVPGGDTLVILPGTLITFFEDVELVVEGVLLAHGDEEDNIRFLGIDEGYYGSISIRGQDELTSTFQYCRFDWMDVSLHAIEGANFQVSNCLFRNNHYAVSPDGGSYEITYSVFEDCQAATRGNCDNAVFSHNSLHGEIGKIGFGISLPGDHIGTFTITDNLFDAETGRVNVRSAEYVLFEGNKATRNLNSTSVNIDDTREVDFINNDSMLVSVRNFFLPIVDVRFEDNFESAMSVNPAGWVESVIATGNHGENSHLYIHNTEQVEIYDNYFKVIGLTRVEEALIHHNLIWQLNVGEGGDIRAINNTFKMDAKDPDHFFIRRRGGAVLDLSLTLINNIFPAYVPLGSDGVDYAVHPEFEDIQGGYNCFYGVIQPYGNDDNLLRGDITEDPLMRGGNPYDYRLRADSPCIDAGDPDSENDPDGTRADIGVFYFDQENGEPPFLDKRWDYYIGWHETFRYAANAVDEGEELEISFEGLPEWLEVEEERVRRDVVRDTVAISGEVPEDQEDFWFNVIATDDAEQTDTLSVRVMVYPYRVLTGIVRGELDLGNSPYIVADTAWVPAGDSLVLPPGTELYFDNREDTLAGRLKSMLMVLGKLTAVGENGDSVFFGGIDPERSNIGIYFGVNHDDQSEFSYCRFRGLRFDYMPHENNITISHSLSAGGGSNLKRINGYSIPFKFNDNVGGSTLIFSGSGTITMNNGGSLLLVNLDSVRIHNNVLGGVSVLSSTSANNVEIYNNIMGPLSLSGVTSNFRVVNNTISGGLATVKLNRHAEAEITNNIIMNATETGLWIFPYDDNYKIVSNNIFLNHPLGVYVYQTEFDENVQINNNIFFNIDTLLYTNRGNTTSLRYNSFYDLDFVSLDTNYTGNLTQVNANGDSVDTYFNLYLDPKLANLDSLDFRLYEDSPLINSGNPDSAFFDLDGTINDIGLFGGPFGEEYEYPNSVGKSDVPVPEGFSMSTLYPNPFNHSTSLSFTIPTAGDIMLKVYDVTGRLVSERVHSSLSAGYQQMVWQAVDNRGAELPTGIYFLELNYSGAKLVQRAVLLR